ncbi:MAG: hypothetical protein IPK80_00775 [Nannocystis sp.]|nr:hypothetical protein [Nannocystis sp.]
MAGLSPRLDSLILSMLHKLPKWRPTARQVESELRAIAHESGVDLALAPALPEEPEAQLRVLSVGKVSASLTASLARRGVLIEPSRAPRPAQPRRRDLRQRLRPHGDPRARRHRDPRRRRP